MLAVVECIVVSFVLLFIDKEAPILVPVSEYPSIKKSDPSLLPVSVDADGCEYKNHLFDATLSIKEDSITPLLALDDATFKTFEIDPAISIILFAPLEGGTPTICNLLDNAIILPATVSQVALFLAKKALNVQSPDPVSPTRLV